MKSIFVAFVVAMGLSATGVMADGSDTPKAEPTKTEAAPAETAQVPTTKKKSKKKKKKAGHSHKFHKEHKLAEVAEPTPTPTPPPVEPPPPAVVEQPLPPPVIVKHEDDSGFYAGGGAGSFRLDVLGTNVNGLGANFRMAGREFGAYGNVGYNFNRNIAVELRAGGVQTESQAFEGAPFIFSPVSVPSVFNADTDGFQSAFLKGTIPFGKSFGIYGLIGATHAIIDLSTNIGALSYRDDYNDSDVSYGAGLQAKLGRSVVIGAEWVRYLDDADGGVAATLEGTVGRLQFQF